MRSTCSSTLFGGVIVALFLLAASSAHANPRPLADAAWLQQALAAGDVQVLDAQPLKLQEAGHTPGPVHVDLFAYGPAEAPGRIARVYIASGAALLFVADDVGEAAMNYYVFQLMGYPNLRVLWR